MDDNSLFIMQIGQTMSAVQWLLSPFFSGLWNSFFSPILVFQYISHPLHLNFSLMEISKQNVSLQALSHSLREQPVLGRPACSHRRGQGRSWMDSGRGGGDFSLCGLSPSALRRRRGRQSLAGCWRRCPKRGVSDRWGGPHTHSSAWGWLCSWRGHRASLAA